MRRAAGHAGVPTVRTVPPMHFDVAHFFEAPPAALRPFVKMHGLGNHFVIFDRRTDRRAFRNADIVRICDARIGVGGDQLLTIEPPSPEGIAGGAYARMRIFNIDGREVSACGNATRCV
ncbi:hypothetical protein ABUE29_26745, partial [Mesorhizobium sp. ZMM04-4]